MWATFALCSRNIKYFERSVPILLNAVQARVIGVLMEKSAITPDQYPLSLNALISGCNQKSSRAPVMALSPGEVLHAVRALQDLHLVQVEENFKTQVEKFKQRLCNTPFGEFQFDEAEYAVVCILLLRGPRTPGEIRSNSGRLFTFSDNAGVEEVLQRLMQREGASVVAQLPRRAGRRDAEYVHLLGDETPDSPSTSQIALAPVANPPNTLALDDLMIRVTMLEAQVERLQAEIDVLKR
jgi:uncharacterized protein YceH (UPF0502 family)